jgi:hypothetical protein
MRQIADPQCPSNAFQLALLLPPGRVGKEVTQGPVHLVSGHWCAPSWPLSSNKLPELQKLRLQGSG